MGKITLLILKISGCFILINIVLFCLYTPEESLGGGYNYNSECKHISGTQINIPPHVTNFNYDKRFIIAKQVLELYNPNPIYNKIEYKYPGPGTYYWIIDKRENNYYGPMNDKAFGYRCDSLSIQLTLDPEKERPYYGKILR